MKSKSGAALLVTAAVLLYITFNLCNWRTENMIQMDSSGYYLYLPATIIYQDLGKLKFYPQIIEKYHLNNGYPTYGLFAQPATGLWVNKYAIGTCLFDLPFFLVAHFYCSTLDHEYPADGYSRPYLVSVVFAYLFWVLAGLFALRKLLARYFSDTATAITLLLLMFGTNLYYYTVFNIGMSHPFSFTLFSFLLYHTDNLYRTGKSKYIVWIGALLGLILIVRPTNILVAMLPLCWPYLFGKNFTDRLLFFRNRIPAIAIAAALFTLISLLLFGYLKYTSGNWLHFSYQGEYFDFLKPEIINGLFSYRKGWFLYTPVALLAVLGLIPLWRQNRHLAIILFAFITLNIYIVFSWCFWAYGGSFGCRALLESMAIMSLPLAAFVQFVFGRKSVLLKTTTTLVLFFFITLNVFQSYQLANNVILWDHTDKDAYWRTFGKLK